MSKQTLSFQSFSQESNPCLDNNTSKVPKLKGKKCADYVISEEEWKMVELVHEILKVILFFPGVYLYGIVGTM